MPRIECGARRTLELPIGPTRFSGIIGILLTLLSVGCSQLPSLDGRRVSTALADTQTTRLGRSIEPLARKHPGASGVVALADGREAFAIRALLIEAAERSVDAQYYIWHEDLSGVLLFEALQRAADRDVRVRLLLDDNRTAGMDEQIAALDAHPGIEVRLFNPFKHRRWRVVDYVGDFSRIQRRMHNKAFIVDNQAAIVGGRNIGDAYFEAQEADVMYDLDALAIGEVVHEISSDFDRYWASDFAYPADRLLDAIEPEAISGLRAAARKLEAEPAARAYMQALRDEPRVHALLSGDLALEWTSTCFVSDDPRKVVAGESVELMLGKVIHLLGPPTHELQLVSPYVVPRKQGVEFLVDAAQRGISVQVLTNSLEATDVGAVHAGYAKWRRRLLEGGVSLFELKRDLSNPSAEAADSGMGGSLGSSASSLHAKTFAADRSRIFIGSFNFDPRSARLNTENGLVIDSPAMARAMSDAFESVIPTRSYEVRLDAEGDLEWIELRGDERIVHGEEPGVTLWQRLVVAMLSVLPIDWLL